MSAGPRLVVTTTPQPTDAMVARARAVAARCDAAYVARGDATVARVGRRSGADAVYVVRRTREQVHLGDGVPLHVHPQLLQLKRRDGRRHPLLRALAPPDGAPLARVLDGTLGLAGDALHVAAVLGVDVLGVEASPVMACLLEAGLRHMAAAGRPWSAGAARVQVVSGQAAEVLATMKANSVSAVYLDPMFEAPAKGPPGYAIFRAFAHEAPLTTELLEAAWRVAARRVVVKVPKTQPPPPCSAGPGWNRRVRGKAVDYVVLEGELERPVYEAPDLGTGAPAGADLVRS